MITVAVGKGSPSEIMNRSSEAAVIGTLWLTELIGYNETWNFGVTGRVGYCIRHYLEIT